MYRPSHCRTGRALPSAVFSSGNASDATDADRATIPSRITQHDRQVADDFIVTIEGEQAPVRIRSNAVPPGELGSALNMPSRVEQPRGLLPANLARLDLDTVGNHQTSTATGLPTMCRTSLQPRCRLAVITGRTHSEASACP